MRKSNITIYSTLALVALLAACRMGKDYQRSDLSLPAQFANTTAPSDSSVADMEWRKFFSDPTLQGLIAHALQNSFDVQLAVKRVDEARAYANQAKVNWAPTIQAQINVSSSFPSENSLNGISLKSFLGKSHIEDYTLGAGLTWEIDIWGKLRRQREAASAIYLQSYEASRAVQTAVVANIASSYFNLLMLDAQLAIARRNVNLGDSIVRIIKLQKDAGQVTELAVQQATAQQQTAALLVPQLEQQIAIQENTIRILSGDAPGTIARTTQLNNFKVWDNLPTGIPAAMVSRRPDVRTNEMALVAANARVGIAEASMYPTISITANGGINAYQFSKWFNIPASLFATGAAGLTQPIFQRRALKTQFEVAKIQREQAAITFRQSAISAIGEVANALVSLDKLKGQHQISNDQVTTLRGAIGNAELLFKSGMADYLEVITAQGNLLQAELNLATVERDQLSAMVELYRALGGGWK
ncbi:efflux transporter outer membrane subunit [Niastella caeni]|uniref:Efflux transporter outer membrane subunit n=1 Tax=Niastella caeni TaxID=2569763 RepID=A0A4S8HCE3_9BACT|nr:efflux transporter outer membrane subunit [Niastella caeni]THU31961.1 efflux transporter outer membrane subunit [Niastella caeni]